MPIVARPASVAQRLFPILRWLPAYRREWLVPDALAGLAVWAVMVPESMAYAGIVGVPPIMGLYTIVPPLITWIAEDISTSFALAKPGMGSSRAIAPPISA